MDKIGNRPDGQKSSPSNSDENPSVQHSSALPEGLPDNNGGEEEQSETNLDEHEATGTKSESSDSQGYHTRAAIKKKHQHKEKHEAPVKKSLMQDTSSTSATATDTETPEDKAEARIMHKLLLERQQYILRDETATDEEEAKTEIEETGPISAGNRRTRSANEHLELPSSIPPQSKIANDTVTQFPGAVRVAGVDGIPHNATEMDNINHRENGDEENPLIMDEMETDISNMTDRTRIQTPQPTVPDYFQEQVLLEATLVTSVRRNHGLGNSAVESSCSRILVEAKPMEEVLEESKDVQCSDVVKSKRLCSRLVIGVVLSVVILLAILIPLGKKRADQLVASGGNQNQETDAPLPVQEPFQSDLDAPILQSIRDPSSPQSRANDWILADPQFANYSSERQQQRFAMASLFFGTQGHNWTRNDKWLDYSADECGWYMSSGSSNICNKDGRLVTMNLTNNNLDGSFGAEIRLFSDLITFDLSKNQLTGTVPLLTLSSQKLEVVDISDNLLSGVTTSEIGLQNLELRIYRNSRNKFAGDISSFFSLAPNTIEFDCSGNLYSGTIPESLGERSTLEVFRFGYNQIRGTLPSEVGMLSLLRELDFPGTKLTGSIPRTAGSLVSLVSADWSNTSLTGTVPVELCQLEANGQLQLSVDCDKVVCCDGKSH